MLKEQLENLKRDRQQENLAGEYEEDASFPCRSGELRYSR